MRKNCNGKRGENLKGLAYVMDKRAEADDIRQAYAKKRRAFSAGAYRIDAPRRSEDGDDSREDRLLGDGGRAAETIRNMGRVPAWVREMNRALETLDGMELLIAEALMRDRRPARVAKMLGTNRMRVYRTIARLREVLAPAYRLYRQHDW